MNARLPPAMTQGKSFGKTIVHVGSGSAGNATPPVTNPSTQTADHTTRQEAPLVARRRVSLNAPPKDDSPKDPPNTKSHTTGDFGGTLVGPNTAPLQRAQVEKRPLFQGQAGKSPTAASSSPPTQQSNQMRENQRALFSATVQGGTAPVFLQSTAPQIQLDIERDSDDDRPVPSVRLAHAVKQELSELDSAINSTRAPGVSQSSRPPQRDPDPKRTDPETNLPRVGRYEVLARLKRGGMGSIYLCRLSGSAGFQRLFAMKVLKSAGAGGDEEQNALGALFREAQVLSQLHHPNIVGIVDVGTPTEPYLVLDYVEGGSLFDLCEQSRTQRDPKKVVTIILDALAGLDAAHRAVDTAGRPLGLVHCDLTPHNLLVSVDGSCRIADFGIARGQTDAEHLGPVWGKPGYMAPERVLGHPTDQRSDLFSMGVVLYYALTGIEPFKGATSEETMRNVVERQVAPPSQVGLCPPPALDWVCMTALEKNPSSRFQTAEEMLSQLRRVVARQEFFSTAAQVAAWVEEAMGPKLEEQRAAVRRSAESKSWPPEAPAYEPVDAPRTAGPRISRPPSSYSPREATLILTEQEQQAAAQAYYNVPPSSTAVAESHDPGRLALKWTRNKPLLLAVGAMVLILLFAMLFPTEFGKVTRTGDPIAGVPTPTNVKVDLKAANPGSRAPTPISEDAAENDIDRVKLPPIKTASESD